MEICSYCVPGREKITYDLCGKGKERKLVVHYTNEDWGASCGETYFKRHGREIDVTFVIGHAKGPSASLPVQKNVEFPLPDELYFLPDKNYKMKKTRLSIYTKRIGEPVGEAPKLRCCRELDHYVPVKIGWLDRLLGYFDLNERFRKASLKKT